MLAQQTRNRREGIQVRELSGTALAVLLAVFTNIAGNSQELPPEIRIDLLLVAAERYQEKGDHFAATEALENAWEMYRQHGLEIPTDHWFRYAQALQGQGRHEDAISAATRYVRETGRDGEHYLSALRILDAAQATIVRQEEEARNLAREVELARAQAAQEALDVESWQCGNDCEVQFDDEEMMQCRKVCADRFPGSSFADWFHGYAELYDWYGEYGWERPSVASE